MYICFYIAYLEICFSFCSFCAFQKYLYCCEFPLSYDFFERQCATPPWARDRGRIHLHLKQPDLNAFNGNPQIFHSLPEELFLTKMCQSEKQPKPSFEGMSWKKYCSEVSKYSFLFHLELCKKSINFSIFLCIASMSFCTIWVLLFPSVLRIGWQIKGKRDHCHVWEISNLNFFLNLCFFFCMKTKW